jgi:hypothetical protein
MPACCFGGKHTAKDSQRFLHDRGKLYHGWHRGNLQTALRALRVQHCISGFQRIRYYGVQATKTLAKVKGAMQTALAKVEGWSRAPCRSSPG